MVCLGMPRTGRPKAVLELTDEEREQLTRWERRRTSSQALALRSRIVLACAAGVSNTRGRRGGGVTRVDGREVAVAVLRAAAGRAGRMIRGRVVRRRSPPSRSRRSWSRRWSRRRRTRRIGRARRWPSARGCRSRRSVGSGGRLSSSRTAPTRSSCRTDPLFVEKVYDIVGLYLNPPEARGGAVRG